MPLSPDYERRVLAGSGEGAILRPMKRASLVIFTSSLLAASAALATTYVRVEKDGTKTYSDRPLPGGQPVELQPAQTYSAPPTPSPAGQQPSARRTGADAKRRISATSCALAPRNDETFQNPEAVTLACRS